MDELQPVDDDEFVYRRIHPKFFRAAAAIPVLYEAFRPSRNDDTGLSVVRARFAKPEDCLADIDPVAVGGYVVAQLSVHELRRLGLTVQPDPVVTGPPGHAIIPELSWDAYQADKACRKLILVELAKLAGAGIVHRPN